MFELQKRFNSLTLFDKIFHTALVFLLIASAGFPLFKSKALDMAIFTLSLAGMIYYKVSLRKSLPYVACYALLILIQTTFFGDVYIRTGIHQLLLFTTGAFSVSVLGINFLFVYQRIILFFTVISLVLFIPILVNYNFHHFLISHFPFTIETSEEFYGIERISYNIFFLNFPPDFFQGFVRNSGPFWEPGAFGGFLVLSLIINALLYNNIFSKKNLFLIAAIITTFSTTTYLAFFFFASAFYFFQINDKLLKGLIVIVFAVGFYFSFNSVSFLGPKIDVELDEIQYEAILYGGNSRSASAYLDLKEVTEKYSYMLFGRGSLSEIRIGGTDKDVLRNNGITDLLARIGFPFFLFYLYTLRKSFDSICQLGFGAKYLSYLALITFLMLAFSETYLKFSFFWALILFCSWSTTASRKPQHRLGNPYELKDARTSAAL